jgi:hypothetical protein
VSGVGVARVDGAERTYRFLLRAYPKAYRDERGEEIVGTLLDAVCPEPSSGSAARGAAEKVDVREAWGLIAGGLRRRVLASDRWLEGIRAASLLMLVLVLTGTIHRAQAQGWVLPHASEDLRWWVAGPVAGVVFTVAALLAVGRCRIGLAWLSCLALAAVRVPPLLLGEALPWSHTLVDIAGLLMGPVVLTLHGGAARRWSWGYAPMLLVLVAPWTPWTVWAPLVSPFTVLLAAAALGMASSARLARGIALVVAGAALRQVSYGYGPDPRSLVVMVAVAGTALVSALVLDRFGGGAAPRAWRRRAVGGGPVA